MRLPRHTIRRHLHIFTSIGKFATIKDVAEIKTTANNASVEDFLRAVPDETKQNDSFALLTLFKKVTGEEPKMWGSSIVGFGKYHYKSQRSKQEGDWPLIGFSPRKQNLTIYIMPGFSNYQDLLARLGKHTTSVGCLYIKKLADVDMDVLHHLAAKVFADMKAQHQ